MLARVPESMWSMRCEMGWPMVMFMPGTSEKSRRRASRNSALLRSRRDQCYVQLGRLHPLGVLVEFGAAGAAGDGDHLGMRQQVLLHDAAQLIGFGSEVPGRVTALIVSAPSLNSGRNARPRKLAA